MLGFVIFAVVAIAGLAIGVLFFLIGPGRPRKPNTFGVPGDLPSNKTTGNISDVLKAHSLHEYLVGLHARHGPLASFYFGKDVVLSAASPQLFGEMSPSFNRPVSLFMLFEPLLTLNAIQYLNGEEGKKRHQRYRQCFQGETLRRFYSIFSAATRRTIDAYRDVSPDQHINLSKDMFKIAMRAITQSAFGDFFTDEGEMETLRDAYDPLWAELEKRLDLQPPTEERQHDFETNRDVVYGLVRRALENRLANDKEQDDSIFIDRLLLDGRPEEENVAEGVTFLVGGFHTTANLLIWAIYCLCLNQAVQDRVAGESVEVLGDDGEPTPESVSLLKYTKQVIDETLRWSVLAPWGARYYDADQQIGGHTIPAETPIITALGVVLQDIPIWPKPEQFDPDRFSPEAVARRGARSFEAFGLSGRKCPGYQFANTESVIVLSMLCRKFRFSLVEEGTPITKVHGLVTHPSRDVIVRVAQR